MNSTPRHFERGGKAGAKVGLAVAEFQQQAAIQRVGLIQFADIVCRRFDLFLDADADHGGRDALDERRREGKALNVASTATMPSTLTLNASRNPQDCGSW